MLEKNYGSLKELVADFIKMFDGKVSLNLNGDSCVKQLDVESLINELVIKMADIKDVEFDFCTLKIQFDLLNENYDKLNNMYEELKKNSFEFEKYWNGYRRQMLKELKNSGASCKNCYWFSKYSNVGEGCSSDYFCSATKWDWEIPENAIDKCICHRYISDKTNYISKLNTYKVVEDETKIG